MKSRREIRAKIALLEENAMRLGDRHPATVGMHNRIAALWWVLGETDDS